MDFIKTIDKYANRIGFRITRKNFEIRHCSDFLKGIVQKCENLTMTEPLAVVGLCEAIEHVVLSGIKGSIVECGVWRGGSMMAAAFTMIELNDLRDIYLYDTFSGMSAPETIDVRIRDGKSANTMEDEYKNWNASLNVVKQNVKSTGYPESKVHFVVGSVIETLTSGTPSEIAVLRLDTDWYQSTHTSLKYLFPALQPGGILIVDDYNYFTGAREAVRQYFQENSIHMFFTRIGSNCAIGVKT